jgi:5-methyltetrahydropteroyltriglutamate--homocysteine methyltransferase
MSRDQYMTGGASMATPYRADHVGSLLRPPELLEAREAFSQNRISAEQLREAEDAAILRALDVQREAGIDIFSDGEYRRGVWYGPLHEGIEGLVRDPNPVPIPTTVRWHGRGNELATEAMSEVGATGMIVGAKLRQTRRFTGHESGFLKQHAPGPWKITMPGVLQRAQQWWKPGFSDQFYPSRQEMVDDLVGMMRAEIKALIDEGVSYIQLDSLTYVIQLADPIRRQALIDAGQDPEDVLDRTIATDNATLEGARSEGVTVGLHMCRGNNRSAWASQGSYEVSAQKAFTQLNVDRFLLEYDTDRAGGFEPLRFIPKGKMVVLGLISSKEPDLEPVDELRRRIDEASKYVPIEHLAISPQCGFASTMRGNQLTWDEQRRKLELIVETARNVWG